MGYIFFISVYSQIIVQKDEAGFTVVQGGLSEYPYCNEEYYTWSEYIEASWLGGRYEFIKYIQWPGASTAVCEIEDVVGIVIESR